MLFLSSLLVNFFLFVVFFLALNKQVTFHIFQFCEWKVVIVQSTYIHLSLSKGENGKLILVVAKMLVLISIMIATIVIMDRKNKREKTWKKF